MAEAKRASVLEFLDAFDKAQPLLDMVVRARSAAHPAYQGVTVDLAASLTRSDMNTGKLTMQRSTEAWSRHLEHCCVKQRRLRLLRPTQVQDCRGPVLLVSL